MILLLRPTSRDQGQSSNFSCWMPSFVPKRQERKWARRLIRATRASRFRPPARNSASTNHRGQSNTLALTLTPEFGVSFEGCVAPPV